MKLGFQTIILIAFGVAAVAGVIAFATFRALGGADANIPEMEMWGTLPEEYFAHLNPENPDPYLKKITYREIPENQFDQTLIEALAEGSGPDLIVLPHNRIVRHKNKIAPFTSEMFSASQFNSSFLPAFDIFRGTEGFYALPGVIDPMVMYWNRDLIAASGRARPPMFWDEMRGVSEDITLTDGFLDISRSGVALGTFDNITHAKDILSLLFMQAGSDITRRSAGGEIVAHFENAEQFTLPASEIINFYVEFADPTREAYSWNSSLPSSREAFLAGDLALYFGKASERDELIEDNPNLSFALAGMPQIKDGARSLDYADLYGFAVLERSDALGYARGAAFMLSSPQSLAAIQDASGLPSARLAGLVEDPEDPYSRTLIDAALISEAWLDPDAERTREFFRELIRSVRSNAADPSGALGRLEASINELEASI